VGLCCQNGTRLPNPPSHRRTSKRIIDAAEPPYDTIFWLVAQTGIRRGEVCALDVAHVNLDGCVNRG